VGMRVDSKSRRVAPRAHASKKRSMPYEGTMNNWSRNTGKCVYPTVPYPTLSEIE
jgi:hypothetical protein